MGNFTVLLFFLTGLSAVANSQDLNRLFYDPGDALLSMLIFESQGDPSRAYFVTYSPRRAAEEKKYDPELMGKVIDIRWDSYFIIDHYKFAKITFNGDDSATAIVISNRLARAERDTIVYDQRQNDSTIYHLIRKKGKWLVLDPPKPRLILYFIIPAFEDDIGQNPDQRIIDSTFSAGQKENLRIEQTKLLILKTLENK